MEIETKLSTTCRKDEYQNSLFQRMGRIANVNYTGRMFIIMNPRFYKQ